MTVTNVVRTEPYQPELKRHDRAWLVRYRPASGSDFFRLFTNWFRLLRSLRDKRHPSWAHPFEILQVDWNSDFGVGAYSTAMDMTEEAKRLVELFPDSVKKGIEELGELDEEDDGMGHF